MGQTTVGLDNYKKPAPKWFRKTKRAILTLTVAANAMVASWGIKNQLLTAHIQLWCTVGIVAVLEALESLLANGDDYVSNQGFVADEKEAIKQGKDVG